MKTLVMKFGGTSVGSPAAIRQTAAIIQQQKLNWDNLVVVVSAMSGVTNQLIQAARSAAEHHSQENGTLVDLIRQRHLDTISDLIPAGTERDELLVTVGQRLDELTRYCQSIKVLGEVTARGMDVISSLGERINAQVVAALLRTMDTPCCRRGSHQINHYRS